nr:hypothetical protein [Fimbriimonadaceae bacterium]
AFQPGDRGLYSPEVLSRHLSENQISHPASQTLRANNQATLAWIGGKSETWTEKSHSFWPGQKIHKSVILINDSRSSQSYEARWGVGSPDSVLKGTLSVGQILILPIEFTTPSQPGSYAIQLSATIGTAIHADRLAFRVFAKPTPASSTLAVWDPVGHTSKILTAAGYRVTPASASSKGLVIVGRQALSSGAKPPFDLEKFTSQGGRLLVMTQDPAWLTSQLGFRVAAYATRRVFPMIHERTIGVGLSGADLADWAGTATLKPAYPDPNTLPRPTNDSSPTHGWVWGMRGVVSSAMVEKPHRTGWTPLLEGEFDLAYSPLLTMSYGKGRVTLCTLDLEDQFASEPVAQLLLPRVVAAASAVPSLPRVPSLAFVGGNSELLDTVGVSYQKRQTLDPAIPLSVIGPDATVSEAQVSRYLTNGGRILFLPRRTGFGPAALTQQAEFGGSLAIPDWPEAVGLSPSDTRKRSHSNSWLVSGVETGADGLLGRWRVGRGVAIFFQMDPDLLNADTRTYFRQTRWRQTRALSQVLTNLGATFPQDSRFFRPAPEIPGSVALIGEWQAQMTQATLNLPATPSNDPGPSPAALALLQGGNEGGWSKIQAPGFWSEMDGKISEAVLRRAVTVPQNWVGKDLVLRLGAVDDYDTTSFNGEIVGQTNRTTEQWWSHRRAYVIPGRLVKEQNVITVRVVNSSGAGGLGGPPHHMGLDLRGFVPPLALYHPDYRSDFELGDDPYRYYRW